MVLKGTNMDIQLLGGEYFKKTYRKQVGLSDTSGHELLKPQFDGIANYTDGYVSLLKNKKFGIYNKNLRMNVSPVYDRLLKPYNDKYMIAFKSNGYGLIDDKGNTISEFEYDDIKYWNDTSLLGLKQGLWNIVDLQTKDVLLDEIRDFDFLAEQDEMIMLFRKEEKFGVVSNTKGLIIEPTFNDILNLGSLEEPVYFTENSHFTSYCYQDGLCKCG